MVTIESQPKLEYSLAGGLLLTLRDADLLSLDRRLSESGYQYGCVLPFRGLIGSDSIERLRGASLKIVHLEEAWNPTNRDNLILAILAGLWGNYRRLLGDRSKPPILQDSFFPSKISCRRLFREIYEAFPKIKFISHDLVVGYPPDRLLVEINPGIELPQEEILEKSQEGGFGLVFDPRHLLSSEQTISVSGKPTRSFKGEWEKQFNIFSSQIEVVDINPPQRDDLVDLKTGRGLLKELAKAAKETGSVRFLRVEVPIPPQNQISGSLCNQKGFDFLRAIGQRLTED